MELLIDGVCYTLRTPKKEEALEDMVKEHAKDIFGEDSIYFDIKQKIKSKASIGSIPDGYAVILADIPIWYIVEIELSSHPVYRHIVPQMGKFILGIKNHPSQREIVDALYAEITKDEALKRRIQSKIGSTEIFKLLSDLVSKPAKLAVVIDQDTEELEEAVEGLKLETEVIEFRTFVREGTGISQHAHLFESLQARPSKDPKIEFLEELRKRFAENKPEFKPSKAFRDFCYIPIAGHRDIHTEWLFWGDEGLGVELHLQRASREENSRLLRELRANSAELEKKIGESLAFEFWRRKWARVYTLREPIQLTEELKQWAVDTMVRFYEAFKPLLDKIDTKS